MKTRFADTSYFVSYLNRHDEHHALARSYLIDLPDPIVTTTWVLAELGNFLARGQGRRRFLPLVRFLRAEQRVTIVPADDVAFESALQLYHRRADKAWSITDCISFVVMRHHGLTEALTTDHHFEQAGFTVLLK